MVAAFDTGHARVRRDVLPVVRTSRTRRSKRARVSHEILRSGRWITAGRVRRLVQLTRGWTTPRRRWSLPVQFGLFGQRVELRCRTLIRTCYKLGYGTPEHGATVPRWNGKHTCTQPASAIGSAGAVSIRLIQSNDRWVFVRTQGSRATTRSSSWAHQRFSNISSGAVTIRSLT
jgi:hypothetical protein